jgi:hypothetical protein
MTIQNLRVDAPRLGVTKALGEEPIFTPGDRVRISVRFSIGIYGVPFLIRGKHGEV